MTRTQRKGLPTASRPPQIDWWVGRGRPYGTDVDIPDVKVFGDLWWKWWRGAQPSWRKPEDDDMVRVVRGPWEKLDRPGQNGMLSVLICLKWWKVEIDAMQGRKKTAELKRWSEGVADAHWVLQGLREAKSK